MRAASSGKRQGQDFRRARPDLGAFDGAVVQEDEAVEPEIQLLRQRPQVGGLGLPVYARRA